MGRFCPQGTLGRVWRETFLIPTTGMVLLVTSGCVMGKLGLAKHRMGPQMCPQMSTVPRLRNCLGRKVSLYKNLAGFSLLQRYSPIALWLQPAEGHG